MSSLDDSQISMEEFEELLERSSVGRGRTREQRYRELRMNPFVEEFQELLDTDEPKPGQLRRMAELVEILRTDEEARPYWERAAKSGDRDAIDYLAVLREEDEE